MSETRSLEALIARAEALLGRLEAVLPHPLIAPDWTAATAFRYRKRGGSGVVEPVRHVASIRLDALVEVELDAGSSPTHEAAAGRSAPADRIGTIKAKKRRIT